MVAAKSVVVTPATNTNINTDTSGSIILPKLTINIDSDSSTIPDYSNSINDSGDNLTPSHPSQQ